MSFYSWLRNLLSSEDQTSDGNRLRRKNEFVQLSLMRLEDRRVLNAEFSLDALSDQLQIENFDGGSNVVTIEDGGLQDFGNGVNEGSYKFNLNTGTWNGLLDLDMDLQNDAIIMGNDLFIRDTFIESGTGLQIEGSNHINIDTDITTAGMQTYNDAVKVTADVTLTSTGFGADGDITFDDIIFSDVAGANSLNVVTAGTTAFNAVVGTTGFELESLTTDAPGSTSIRANINTTKTQIFGDDVLLANDVTLTSTGFGADGFITFDKTLEGNGIGVHNLTVNTASRTTFTGEVGGNGNELQSITTNATMPNGSVFVGNNVSTFGFQNYGDIVTLTNDVVITSTNNKEIKFQKRINGTAHSFTVNTSGNTLFEDSLSTKDLTTDAGGNTILGGNVTTAGIQTYNDAVKIDNPVSLKSNNNANITFMESVDSNTGPQSLNLITEGTVTFNKDVGTANALSVLATNLNGNTILNGNVTTTDIQRYNGDLTVNTDVTLKNTSNKIVLTNTTTSNNRLDIQATGDVELGTLTSTSNSPNALKITSTAGTITSNDVITVANGTATFSADGNDITLDNVNNNFNTVVVTKGQNVVLKDVDDILLGHAEIAGTYDVTTGGHITQSSLLAVDNIIVDGIGTFTTPNGFNITLNNPFNDFNQVNLFDDDATIVDINGILVGNTNISGTLSVTAGTFIEVVGDVIANDVLFDASTGAGNIFESGIGKMTITGISTFNAQTTDDILLGGTNNFNTVVIAAGNNVTLNDTASGINLGAADVEGTFTVTATSNIINSGVLDIMNTATFNAVGNDITLSQANNFLADVLVNGKDVALNDVNDIDLGTSDVSGTYTVTAGNDITNSGDLVVTGKSTFNATNHITLQQANNNFSTVEVTTGVDVSIVDMNTLVVDDFNNTGVTTLDVTAGTVTQAGGSAITSNELLLKGGADFTLTNTTNTVSKLAADTTGDINYRNQDNFNIDTVAGTTGITTSGGSITVLSDAGLNVNEKVDSGRGGTSNGGDINLNAGTLNLNAVVTTAMGTGGTFTLQGTTIQNGIAPIIGQGNLTLIGGGADTIINSPITTTGGIDITAQRHVIFGVNGDLNSNDFDINITAATTLPGGEITMVDGTEIDAGMGKINLQAEGDIALGLLTTTNATADAVIINTTMGAVTDANLGNRNIDANAAGAKVTITSQDGIGATGPLNEIDTAIAELDATVTGTGDIHFTEADAIIITNATTNNGLITVMTTDGTITATNVDSSMSALFFGHIRLVASGLGADILVTSINSGPNNNSITLIADDDVLDTDMNDLNVIQGTSLGVNSSNNKTADGAKTIQLTTDVTGTGAGFTGLRSLSVGDIEIVEKDEIRLFNVVAFDGAIDITAGGSINATTVTSTNTNNQNDHDINLTANGAASNIAVTSFVDAKNNADVKLQADGNVIVNAGKNVRAIGAGGEVEIMAGNNVRINGTVSTTDSKIETTAIGNTIINGKTETTSGLLNITANGNIDMGMNAEVKSTTGNVTFTADNSIGNNGGFIDMQNGAVIDAGTGEIKVEADGNINIAQLKTDNTSNDAILITSTSGAVNDAGDTDVDIVANQPNAKVTINATTGIGVGANGALETDILDFTSTTGGNINIAENDALVLNTITTTNGGGLNITTGGHITNSNGLTIQGATTLNAGPNDVTLNQLNDFQGAVGITGKDVVINDINNLNLGTSDVSGTYTVTAEGDITNSGDLIIDGNATFTAANGVQKNITLDQNNDFKSPVVIVDANDVLVNDINNIALGASMVGGTMLVTAVTGDITQMGDLNIAGASTFNAGMNVRLDRTNNDFSSVSANTGNSVTLEDKNDITLTNITTTDGDVTVHTTNGSITAETIISNASRAISLNAEGANGDVIITTLVDAKMNGLIDIDAERDVIINAGATVQAVDAGGKIEIDAVNNVDIKGTVSTLDDQITINSGSDILLGVAAGINSTSGDVTLNAVDGNVTMSNGSVVDAGSGKIAVDANDIGSGKGNVALGHLKTTNATVDAITIDADAAVTDANGNALNIEANNPVVPGARVTINAVTTIGDGNALETNVHEFKATANGNIEIVEVDNIILNQITTTNNGTLMVTAGGNITNSNLLDIAGKATFNAVGSDITLDQDNNFRVGISTNGKEIIINDVDTLDLDTSTVTGTYFVTTTGNITNSGDLDITDTATFDADVSDVTLDQNNDFKADVNVSGQNAALNDINDLEIGVAIVEQNFTATAMNDLTLINVISGGIFGSVDLTATTGAIIDGGDLGGADIIAAEAALRAATGIGNGNALETEVFTIAAITTAGNIEFNSNSPVLQIGTVNTGQLNELKGIKNNSAVGDDIIILNQSFISVDDDIVNNSGNINLMTDFDDLTVNKRLEVTTGAGAVNLNAGNDLILNNNIKSISGAINTSANNNVTFNTTGKLETTTGNINVVADNDVDADGTGGAVEMQGNSSITTDTGRVAISADQDVTLQKITTNNNSNQAFNVTAATGGITGNEIIKVINGTSSLDAAIGSDITFDNAANDLNRLVVQQAKDVVIHDINNLVVTSINVANTAQLDVTAGNVTQTGDVTADKLLLLGGANNTLNNATNNINTLAANITGTIDYRNQSTFEVGSVNGTDGVSTNGNRITIQSDDVLNINKEVASGNGIDGAEITLTGLNRLNLNAIVTSAMGTGGTLTIDGMTIQNGLSPVVGKGNITLLGGALDTIINSTITTTGGIDITARRNIQFGATGNLNSNGNHVNITAATTTAGGQIMMDSNSTINTGAGNVTGVADGDITVGRIDSTGIVDLTSLNAAIVDADNDQSIDIVATSVALRAKEGIGSGNKLETMVSRLAARNETTGHLQIDNMLSTPLEIGTVNGGMPNELIGVTNKSANTNFIELTNKGDINVNENITNATGDITLNTTMASDLITNANVEVQGGTGSILLNVSKDLIINDSLNPLGGNDVLVGGSGTFTANVTNNTAINANASVTTTNQQITFNTDEMAIDAAAGINSGTERTIIRPHTPGDVVSVELGTNSTTADTLELNETELDQITASVLEIGSGDTKNIIVTNAINPANVNTLHLISGSTLNATGNGTITETNLAIEAETGVDLTNNNNVETLAIDVNGSGDVNFTDVDTLTIGSVDTVVGITTKDGHARVTTGGLLTIDDDVNIGAKTFTVDSAAGATQNVGKDITANNLELQGTGPFTLTNETNKVDTLAADVDGTLDYHDADDLNVGISGTTTGINTTDTLDITTGNDLDIKEAIATTNDDVTLNALGNIEVNATLATHGGKATFNAQEGVAINQAVTTNSGLFEVDADTNADATGAFNISATGSVNTNNEEATITAADVNLEGAFDVGNKQITLLTSTPGQTIGLGGGVPALFTLEDADADHITATTLQVGDATHTGGFEVRGQLTADGHYQNLNLMTQSTLTDNVATEQTDITVDNLNLTIDGGIGNAGAGDIDLNVESLTTTTIDSDQFIEEADDLSAINLAVTNLVAGTERIDITAGGTIQDADATADITASEAIVRAGNGIGNVVSPINTVVENIEADGGLGGLFVTNDGGLTIGGIANGLAGGLGATVASGDIDITAMSPLTVNQKVLNSGEGNVKLKAEGAGDVTLQDQVQAIGTNATVHLDAGSAIVDDHENGGAPDVLGKNIALEANDGIGDNGSGSSGTVETAGEVISAENKTAGEINIANNNGGGDLSIGAVPVAGLPAGAGIHSQNGAVNVSNSGTLTVDAGAEVIVPDESHVTLAGMNGGDVNLHGQVKSDGGDILFEADEELNFFDTGDPFDVQTTGAGTIIGTHNGTVTIADDVLLSAASGTIASVDPFLEIAPPALVSPVGAASLDTRFGIFGEETFTVTVDWFQSAAEVGLGVAGVINDQFFFQQFFTGPGETENIFNFRYLTHPDPANAADDIPFSVFVVRSATHFGAGSIQIGQTDLDVPVDLGIPVPGNGFGAGEAAPLSEAPSLVFPENTGTNEVDFNQTTTFSSSTTQQETKTTEETTSSAKRVVLLRVISPTGKPIEDVPLTAEMLDDLPALYKKLFDGHYQIIVKEPSSNPESQKERIVSDVKIRNGQVADEKNQTERPPSSQNNQSSDKNKEQDQTESSDPDQTSQLGTLQNNASGKIRQAIGSTEVYLSETENEHDLFWSTWGVQQKIHQTIPKENETALLQVPTDYAKGISAGAFILAAVRSQKPKSVEEVDNVMERYKRNPR